MSEVLHLGGPLDGEVQEVQQCWSTYDPAGIRTWYYRPFRVQVGDFRRTVMVLDGMGQAEAQARLSAWLLNRWLSDGERVS